MAFYISVKKIFEDINQVNYKVDSNDFGGIQYFIHVKKEEDNIYIYNDIHLNDMLGQIDLNKLNQVIKIPGIPNQVLWYSLTKLIKNMKNNFYPDHLDYVC